MGSFNYGFTNDGNEPTHEQTRLVIEINGKYSTALRVLDAARLEYSDIAEEEQRQFMDKIFKR